jgi:hypothetical protein
MKIGIEWKFGSSKGGPGRKKHGKNFSEMGGLLGGGGGNGVLVGGRKLE